MIRGELRIWQSMSANPFANIINQRASFDRGQRAENVDGLAGARIDTFAPPLFQSTEKAQLKVNAPPIQTLDFNAAPSLPGENAIGILKPRAQDAVSTPTESVSIGNSQPKRTPALNFAEFPAAKDAAAKFEGSGFDLTMKPLPDGSMLTTKTFTAKDFSMCKMYGKDDGTSGIVITDTYGRPKFQEDIDPKGGHTLTKFTYEDVAGRNSPFAKTKDLTYPDGRNETLVRTPQGTYKPVSQLA